MSNIVWKDRKRTLFGLPWSFTKYSLSDDRLFISTGFQIPRKMKSDSTGSWTSH